MWIKWEHIDIEARDSFAKAAASKVTCAAGASTHGERTKFIDKNNKCTACPMCNAEES